MTNARFRASASRLALCAAIVAAWPAAAAAAQGEPAIVFVPADRVRSMEANQNEVTGLLRTAYEEVELASEFVGDEQVLAPALDAIAEAGRRSHALASPSRETHEGFAAPLIAICDNAPAAAWTRDDAADGFLAGSRLSQVAQLLKSFPLFEAYEAVVSAGPRVEATEKAPPEAMALLERAASSLRQALHVYEQGVLGPFARFVGEAAEQLADAALVRELCGQANFDEATALVHAGPGHDHEATPDPESTQTSRNRHLGTMRSALATLDHFVLPRGSSLPNIAQGFAAPVRTRAVQPVYSNFARRSCIEGEVRLEIRIGRDGEPQRIRVLQGSPELSGSAVAAARQWRFEPARLDGQTIAFDYRLTVNFNLDGEEATRCRQLPRFLTVAN